MEIGDKQFPCTPDEYFDGVEDKCIPCEDVCTREPLTFCKNNCPEFYKKLATATYRSIAHTSRTTFVDDLFSTLSTTEPSPSNTSRTVSSIQLIPFTTLLALIAAVIAICIAVVAFILIWKARRREQCDRKGRYTEDPLLRRTESDSLGRGNFSTRSSNGDSLSVQNETFKAPLDCNYANPPDVARDAKTDNNERTLENMHTASESISNSTREQKACVGDIQR